MKMKSSSRLNEGGVKKRRRRRRIMTKIETGAHHNQNTPSGGFEKVIVKVYKVRQMRIRDIRLVYYRS